MTAIRVTRQRDVISGVLDRAQGPLSIPEVYEQAREEMPKLGIATVYRTLKLLSEQGRIQHLSLDGETLYEKSGLGQHHHFRCRSCKKTFAIHESFVQLPPTRSFGEGFVIDDHELTLYGRCAECSKKSS